MYRGGWIAVGMLRCSKNCRERVDEAQAVGDEARLEVVEELVAQSELADPRIDDVDDVPDAPGGRGGGDEPKARQEATGDGFHRGHATSGLPAHVCMEGTRRGRLATISHSGSQHVCSCSRALAPDPGRHAGPYPRRLCARDDAGRARRPSPTARGPRDPVALRVPTGARRRARLRCRRRAPLPRRRALGAWWIPRCRRLLRVERLPHHVVARDRVEPVRDHRPEGVLDPAGPALAAGPRSRAGGHRGVRRGVRAVRSTRSHQSGSDSRRSGTSRTGGSSSRDSRTSTSSRSPRRSGTCGRSRSRSSSTWCGR